MSESGGELRADPAVLAATCTSLSAAADHMLHEVQTLDGQVESMLANWQGQSGGTYRDAWALWSKGADDVERGLAIMAELLDRAAKAYAEQDAAARAQLGGLHE